MNKQARAMNGSGLFVSNIAKGGDALATSAHCQGRGRPCYLRTLPRARTPLLPHGRRRYFRISTSVRMLWSHLESNPPSGSKENHAS